MKKQNASEKKYYAFVASLRCAHCGVHPTQVHHVIGTGYGKMGGKSPWIATVPLCFSCHAEVHKDPKSYPQLRWLMQTLEAAVNADVLVVK